MPFFPWGLEIVVQNGTVILSSGFVAVALKGPVLLSGSKLLVRVLTLSVMRPPYLTWPEGSVYLLCPGGAASVYPRPCVVCHAWDEHERGPSPNSGEGKVLAFEKEGRQKLSDKNNLVRWVPLQG